MFVLGEFIESLNNEETHILELYFTRLQSKSDATKASLSFKLYELIQNGKAKSDKEASLLIYGKASCSSYSHLKSRLYNLLINTILISNVSSSTNTGYLQAKGKARRLFNASQILLIRQKQELGTYLMKDSLAICKRYQLNFDHTLIKYESIKYLSLRLGESFFKKEIPNLKSSLRNSRYELKAYTLYTKAIVSDNYLANTEFAPNFLDVILSRFNKLVKLSNLSIVNYYYLKFKIFYYYKKNQFQDSYTSAYQFLDTVKNDFRVRSDSAIAGAYMSLSNVDLKLFKFNECIFNGEKAVGFFKPSSLNMLTAYSNYFYSYLYKGEYTKADKVLNIVKNESHYKNNRNIWSLWNILEANLLFLKGDYDDSLKLLQYNNSLIETHYFWKLNVKILELLNILELKNFDWLPYRIDSLGKLFLSLKKYNLNRYGIILNIIKNFERHAYVFDSSFLFNFKKFTLLASSNSDVTWFPGTYEIIPFHDWFISHVSKKTLESVDWQFPSIIKRDSRNT